MRATDARATVRRMQTFAGEAVLLHGQGRTYEAQSDAGAFSLKMVRRGAATWRAAGRAVTLRESTYLFLPPETPYRVSIDEESGAETACLFFPREMLAAVRPAAAAEALLDEESRGGEAGWHIGMCAADAMALDRLVRLVVHGAPASGEQIDDLMLSDVPRLFAASLGVPSWRLQAARASTRHELARRVSMGRDFLVDQLSEPLDLRAAARAAGLSPFHFHRSFRTLFGVPPLRYVTERRLERAAFLLRHSSLPVTDVCYRVGYESLGSFSRAFAQRFGRSPGRFRHAAD